MTEKNKLFGMEYLKDFNGTRAYTAVYENGAPLKNAKASAYRLLQKEEMRMFLTQEMKKIKEEKVAEAQEVMAYFTSVMRGEIEMSDRERNKAAELLAKRFGLLDEAGAAGGTAGVMIVDDV